MPKIGVILSGCGVFDGAEIHEAVITLLCLDQLGVTVQCLAPNRSFDVVDHLTKHPAGEKRNVLAEAARIARGDVADLAGVKGTDFDALVVPGGFGVAKNLCSFAARGPDCDVDPHVRRVLTEAQQARRPLAFLCIAPALAAKLFGASAHPQLTIGHDPATAAALNAMGARHQPCDAAGFILDESNRILSTPAYMEAKSIKDVYAGISKLIARLVEMVKHPAGGQ